MTTVATMQKITLSGQELAKKLRQDFAEEKRREEITDILDRLDNEVTRWEEINNSDLFTETSNLKMMSMAILDVLHRIRGDVS